MMERIRKEMILMERGLHSPAAGKRLSNLSDSAGNAVLEALENSQHSGRLSPRLTSASLHNNVGDVPSKSKFEIDSLFNTHHQNSDNNSSSEISSSENRKKITLYPEVHETDMDSDVEVGCAAHRSPNSLSAAQHKENKGDVPAKSKFEIDSLFNTHHQNSDNNSSSEISSSENRKKITLYPEVHETDMDSDVEVGCAAHRSPNSLSAAQHKENKDEKLEELKAQKKKILEEVMEKETYKTAKLILERFDPDSKKKNVSPLTICSVSFSHIHFYIMVYKPFNLLCPMLGFSSQKQPFLVCTKANFVTLFCAWCFISTGLHPPGPPLARAILPRERGVMDRVVEFLVGDGPQNRYALVCQQCFSHNGMALKEEFEYVAFRCAYCYFLNPARKTRPQAPRLPDFSFERRPCTDSQTSGVSAEAGVPENQPSAGMEL
ncbi:UNVERIFIED_CONTAM: hypothetical protein FKN15_056462 [Acipenser sinensis]